MKAKYLSLLALSALLVSCGPTTSGPTDVVYANYSEVRSIKTVATNLMKNPNWRTVYPEAWKQEIIEYCAAFED